MKRTPGPWRVIDRGATRDVMNPNLARFWIGTMGRNGGYGTEQIAAPTSGDQRIVEPVEVEGNAYGIAAVPDMIAALEEIINFCEARGDLSIILDAALLAVRKATGGAE